MRLDHCSSAITYLHALQYEVVGYIRPCVCFCQFRHGRHKCCCPQPKNRGQSRGCLTPGIRGSRCVINRAARDCLDRQSSAQNLQQCTGQQFSTCLKGLSQLYLLHRAAQLLLQLPAQKRGCGPLPRLHLPAPAALVGFRIPSCAKSVLQCWIDWRLKLLETHAAQLLCLMAQQPANRAQLGGLATSDRQPIPLKILDPHFFQCWCTIAGTSSCLLREALPAC